MPVCPRDTHHNASSVRRMPTELGYEAFTEHNFSMQALELSCHRHPWGSRTRGISGGMIFIIQPRLRNNTPTQHADGFTQGPMDLVRRQPTQRRTRFNNTEESLAELQWYADKCGMDLANFFYPFSDFIFFEDTSSTPSQEAQESNTEKPQTKRPSIRAPQKSLLVNDPSRFGTTRNPRSVMRSRKSLRVNNRTQQREQAVINEQPCR